ncbi:MAG: sugar phosphate isomerase/epimerase [Alistipes sp.]|nr:sugar phosphate isomerase/epimerase [Alistipes sp.]
MIRPMILRRMLRQACLWLGIGVLGCASGCSGTQAPKQELKLCMQSYTFHKFTLEEALDKTAQLGLTAIEVFPGHRLSERFGDQTFGPSMDSATRVAVLQMAAERGIRIVATGVCVPDSAPQWPAYFDFARDMGIEVLTCEPALGDWDAVEQLSRQTGIKVAVHNHPQPSHYWHPDSLMAQIAGRDSARIGSCADIGHWKREGVDPLTALQTLDGRVRMAHFKDIASAENGAHDLIWGTGVLDLPAIVNELRRQHFDGYLSIEYEYNWENSVPDIQQSIAYFQTL